MKKSAIIAVVVIVIIVAAIGAYFATLPPTPPPPPPPKKPEKIYYGAAICLTGAFAGPAADADLGLRDAIRYVNEQGGIEGVPIELVHEDNEYKPETTIKIFTKWKEQYPLSILHTCGSHVVAALYPLISEAKIPYTDPSMQGTWANASKYPWYFLPPSASYTDQYRAFLKWFKDNWTEERAPRCAIIWETKAFGLLIKPSVEDYAKYLGYEVTDEVVEICSTSAYEQISRLKAWKPDVICVMVPPSETAVVLKNATELGLKAEWCLFYYSFFWEPLVKLLGPLAEGKYVGSSMVPWGYNCSAMKLLMELNEKWHPGNRTSMYIYGWVHTMVNLEAIRISLKTFGDVDGEHVRKAFEMIKDFDTGGLTPPITYTEKDHRGTTTVWVWVCKDGKFVKVAEVTFPRDDPWFGR